MRRLALDLAVLAVLATAGLGLTLAFHWTTTGRAFDGWLLALGGLAALGLLAETRESAPHGRSPFDAALVRRPARDEPLAQLERLRRETALGVARSFDFHVRLRPILREVAARRLGAHGVELDTPQAGELLGAEAWELLRSDRPLPEDRFARGIPPDDLSRLLDTLERL